MSRLCDTRGGRAGGVAVRGDNPLAEAHVGKFYSLCEQSERFKLGDKPNP